VAGERGNHIIVLPSFCRHILCYVNNILEKDNQGETPGKWEKKRLKIFP
jgi:hypothetical protein